MTGKTRLAALSVWVLFVLLLLPVATAGSRDAARISALEAEARQIAAQPFLREGDKPVIVVTGSSTVRLWPSGAATFPDAQVVNTGFGGSTMDALAAHYDVLIGRYAPDQVFIGSGDNDLARGRSPEQVIADTAGILDRIAAEMPGTSVAIIAAKPSVKRWHLRDAYEELNADFEDLAAAREHVAFVDVWHPLLDEEGQVRPELYAADGLHLNRSGYRIYSNELRAAEDVPALAARELWSAARR